MQANFDLLLIDNRLYQTARSSKYYLPRFPEETSDIVRIRRIRRRNYRERCRSICVSGYWLAKRTV